MCLNDTSVENLHFSFSNGPVAICYETRRHAAFNKTVANLELLQRSLVFFQIRPLFQYNKRSRILFIIIFTYVRYCTCLERQHVAMCYETHRYTQTGLLTKVFHIFLFLAQYCFIVFVDIDFLLYKMNSMIIFRNYLQHNYLYKVFNY